MPGPDSVGPASDLDHPRRRWPWILGIVAVLAGIAVASVSGTMALQSMVSDAPTEVTCPGADGRTAELRRCLQPLLAFVETPDGAGTGVLLADGFVVTNAHVVDPWEVVTVTVGGTTYDELDVVGVDASADIALIGPITDQPHGVELAPAPSMDDEEPDVFLVGYPGGVEGADPAIAISDGVLSRLRVDESTGLTYLQTDAAIAGGQSGGALVDPSGRVLGISGLGFAEEFALALATDDVMDAVDRIRSTGGDDRRTIPTGDDDLTTSGSLSLDEERPSGTLILPPGDQRTVELVVEAGAPVSVDISTAVEMVGSNEQAIDQLLDDEVIDEEQADDLPRLDEPVPGTYRFDAPKNETVYVIVGVMDEPVDVEFSADTSFVVFGETVEGAPLEVGSTRRGVLDAFAVEAIHELEVTEAGDLVFEVSAGASDAYLTVLPPGERYDYYDSEVSADDGGGGLYGLDARYEVSVEPEDIGTWRVVVGTWDGVITGYSVSVRRP